MTDLVRNLFARAEATDPNPLIETQPTEGRGELQRPSRAIREPEPRENRASEAIELLSREAEAQEQGRVLTTQNAMVSEAILSQDSDAILKSVLLSPMASDARQLINAAADDPHRVGLPDGVLSPERRDFIQAQIDEMFSDRRRLETIISELAWRAAQNDEKVLRAFLESEGVTIQQAFPGISSSGHFTTLRANQFNNTLREFRGFRDVEGRRSFAFKQQIMSEATAMDRLLVTLHTGFAPVNAGLMLAAGSPEAAEQIIEDVQAANELIPVSGRGEAFLRGVGSQAGTLPFSFIGGAGAGTIVQRTALPRFLKRTVTGFAAGAAPGVARGPGTVLERMMAGEELSNAVKDVIMETAIDGATAAAFSGVNLAGFERVFNRPEARAAIRRLSFANAKRFVGATAAGALEEAAEEGVAQAIQIMSQHAVNAMRQGMSVEDAIASAWDALNGAEAAEELLLALEVGGAIGGPIAGLASQRRRPLDGQAEDQAPTAPPAEAAAARAAATAAEAVERGPAEVPPTGPVPVERREPTEPGREGPPPERVAERERPSDAQAQVEAAAVEGSGGPIAAGPAADVAPEAIVHQQAAAPDGGAVPNAAPILSDSRPAKASMTAADLRQSFPTARAVTPLTGGDGFRIELRRGQFFDVRFVDQIAIDWDVAEASYGREFSAEERQAIEERGGASGAFVVSTGDRIANGLGTMLLAAGQSTSRTVLHENIHLLRRSEMITDREWDAMVTGLAPEAEAQIRSRAPEATPQEIELAVEEAVARAAENQPQNVGFIQRLRELAGRFLDKIMGRRSARAVLADLREGRLFDRLIPETVPADSGRFVGGAEETSPIPDEVDSGEPPPDSSSLRRGQTTVPIAYKLTQDEYDDLDATVRRLFPFEELRERNRNVITRIVETINQLPGIEETRRLIQLGARGRRWYTYAKQTIDAMIPNPQDRWQFTAVLAATSPNKNVSGKTGNLDLALSVWEGWEAAGRPSDRITIERMLRGGETGLGNFTTSKILNLDSDVRNTIAALTASKAEDVMALMSDSSPKVKPFYQALAGDLSAVVNDTWMARFFGVPKEKIGNVAIGKPITAMTTLVAQELGWAPAEAQAAGWAVARILGTRISNARRAGRDRKSIRKLMGEEFTEQDIFPGDDIATLMISDTEVVPPGRKVAANVGANGLRFSQRATALGWNVDAGRLAMNKERQQDEIEFRETPFDAVVPDDLLLPFGRRLEEGYLATANRGEISDEDAKRLGWGVEDYAAKGAWESMPSEATGLLPELQRTYDNEREQRIADRLRKRLHREVQKILALGRRIDRIAEITGVQPTSISDSVGVWESASGVQYNPMSMIHFDQVANPEDEIAARRDAANIARYMAVLGMVTRQEGVAVSMLEEVPDLVGVREVTLNSPGIDQVNAVEWRPGRSLTRDEISAIRESMVDRATPNGQEEFAIMGRGDGLRIIKIPNFEAASMPNREFVRAVNETLTETFPDVGTLDVAYGRQNELYSDYIANDWEANTNGESYQNQIGALGREQQEAIRNLAREIADVVDDVGTEAEQRLPQPAEIDRPTRVAEALDLAYNLPLEPDQQQVQDELDELVVNNLDEADALYESLPDTNGGRVLNVDEARNLSPAYLDRTQRGRHTISVHEPASKYVKDRYARMLDEPSQGNGVVMMLAGGGGSGKTFAVSRVFPNAAEDSDIVYDATLTKTSAADAAIRAALDSGREVDIVFVWRPFEQAMNAMLNRGAKTGASGGRFVPVQVLAEAHVGSQRTVLQLVEHYENDARVSITIVDNSGATPESIREADVDFLQSVLYPGSIDEAAAELNALGLRILDAFPRKGELNDGEIATILAGQQPAPVVERSPAEETVRGAAEERDAIDLARRRGLRPQRAAFKLETEEAEAAGAGEPEGRAGLAIPAETEEGRQFIRETDPTLPDRTQDPAEVQAEATRLLQDRAALEVRILEAGSGGERLSNAEVIAGKRIVGDYAHIAFRSSDAGAIDYATQLLDAWRRDGAETARALGARFDPVETPLERAQRHMNEAMLYPNRQMKQRLDDIEREIAKDRRILRDERRERGETGLSLPTVEERVTTTEQALAAAVERDADAATVTALQRQLDAAQRVLAEERRTRKMRDAEAQRLQAKLEALRKREVSTKDKLARREITTDKATEELSKIREEMRKLNAKLDARERKLRRQGKSIFVLRRNERNLKEKLAIRDKLMEQSRNQLQTLRANLRRMGYDFNLLSTQEMADPIMSTRIIRDIGTQKADWYDKQYEYWINAILSGPQTQGANIVGNTGMVLWTQLVQRTMERTFGSIASIWSDDPSLPTLAELPHVIRGFLPGLLRGVKNFWIGFSTEQPVMEDEIQGVRGVDKQERFKPSIARGGIPVPSRRGVRFIPIPGVNVGRIVRLPGRFLRGADEFFKGLITTMEVGAEAYRIAKGEGLEGAEMEQRIQDLHRDMRSPAWKLAYVSALDQVFQTKVKGRVGRALHTIRQIPFLRYIVPFTTTPYNLVRIGVRKSPLGSLNLVARLIKTGVINSRGGSYKYPTNELIQDASEQLIAWAITMLLVEGIDDEDPWITGSASADPALRSAQFRDRQPTSVRIGDEWWNYNRVEPFSTGIVFMIDGIEAAKKSIATGTPAPVAGAGISTFVSTFRDKTFLRGIGDIINAVESTRDKDDPVQNKGIRWVSNFGASWVPNVFRQIERNVQPAIRERRLWGEGHEWASRAGHRFLVDAGLGWAIPTEPKIDVWGREIDPQSARAATNYVWRILSPIRANIAEPDPLDQMLFTFNQAEPDKSWFPHIPDPGFGKDAEGNKRFMTDAQYREFMEESGQRAHSALLAFPPNLTNPSADDVEVVNVVLHDIRRRTRERMILRDAGVGGAAPSPADIAQDLAKTLEIVDNRFRKLVDRARTTALPQDLDLAEAFLAENRSAIEMIRQMKRGRKGDVPPGPLNRINSLERARERTLARFQANPSEALSRALVEQTEAIDELGAIVLRQLQANAAPQAIP